MGDAIFVQKSGLLGVGIVARCGVLTPNQLSGLARLAQELDCKACKLTTRQTLIFLLPEDKLEALRAGVEALGLRIGVFGEIVRNVKACAGSSELCQRSLADVYELAGRLQDRFMNRPVPNDFKISVAGCHRGCTEPFCADYGVVATGEDRYNVYLGGRGASKKPVHAALLAEGINSEGVIALLDYILERYTALAQPKERLCHTISRVGWEAFQPPEELLRKFRQEEERDFLNFLAQVSMGEKINNVG
ncbi:Nitrite/Sulfite reductase ferredoxin-like half domain-containing protein [Thermanaeromonas toyohensis ToBE]|uniref:Nitrite/Sulfite reductase ferredoxin-like half domain-containing protein n=1 Tax=Thermanaeromonas toyohensis ToBE TaxID=698762 RepID=A0A1W1W322_9FIRM|nr:nitrite reductase [Thermanaeromonas toyohensis]SMC00018.1 Nitrite/Sulfite reductase ferredoxin-like half domain-containing protein [Thermanaeromonas toyohensis ToBE]